jgi:hypothetical protein
VDRRGVAVKYCNATIKKLSLHSQGLKIRWGKPSPMPSQVTLATSQSNVSRNVYYLSGLDEGTSRAVASVPQVVLCWMSILCLQPLESRAILMSNGEGDQCCCHSLPCELGNRL